VVHCFARVSANGTIVGTFLYFLLHIGRTGGTYSQGIFASIPGTRDLVRGLTHEFNLETALNGFPGEGAMFGIREPLAIFVSGFYSRIRKGRPRYNVPWSKNETKAFSFFQTPNQLAEALSSDDPLLRERAEFSMRSITHVARCLHFFLKSASYVREQRNRISWIFRQATLDEDIQRFLDRIGVRHPHAPIQDEVFRHSNPSAADKSLSPTAIRNLTVWYKADLEIYEECQLLAANLDKG
jgi:hypothetical protein